jgi:hypothetical protein
LRRPPRAKRLPRSRKPKTIRKKPPKKAPLRRISPKKTRPTAKVAVKPTPVSAPAQPEAVRPTPSLAAQPAPPAEPGERIGVVTHYYSHLSVAIIRLESGTLRVGDVIQEPVLRTRQARVPCVPDAVRSHRLTLGSPRFLKCVRGVNRRERMDRPSGACSEAFTCGRLTRSWRLEV